MPIVWSLSLTDTQISLLRAFAAWEEPQARVVERIQRDPKKIASPLGLEDDSGEGPWLKFSHFVSHLRVLLRDQMVVHESLRYGPNLQWVYNVYTLTEKAWYVLRIVEIEMEEMRERHQLGDGLPSSKGMDVRRGLETGRAAKKKLQKRDADAD